MIAVKLSFPKRGVRRRLGYGLHYRSACGRFVVYKSCECLGVELPVRWLAIAVTRAGQRIISRHRKRSAAERACQREANA